MKQLEKWLKKFLIFLIKLLIPERKKEIVNNKWQNFQRILVFRLDNRFGNSILILSLVQSIKDSLPDASVDILMTSSYIKFYENHPAIQTVIPYDQKYLFRNPVRFLLLIRLLRKNNYDAVFSSNNPDAFSVSQVIFNLLVTKNRSVGFDWKESSKLYTDVVTGNTSIHYSKSQYDLWRHFDKKANYSPPKLYYISKKNIIPDKSLLLWLGATGNKILSEELVDSIIVAIEKLKVNYNLAVGPNDQQVREAYKQQWRDDIQTINLDLPGIGKYFLSFKCIIIPDTGPMHLVAALNIPLIQVFVDSNVKQYGYNGSNKYIIDKKLDSDSLKQVIRKQLDSTR